MTVDYFNKIKDYIHPNLETIIKDYQNGNLITLNPYHGCGHRNKNGTRKLIDYARGYRCVTPAWRNYWKKDVRAKCQCKICDFYVTRHMTQTKFKHLVKNKGYLIYNFKLEKYEHINKTPLYHEFKSMQQFKNECFSLKMPCYKKHKAFLIYSRLSTKEGLFTETTVKDQDVRFGKYNQDLY